MDEHNDIETGSNYHTKRHRAKNKQNDPPDLSINIQIPDNMIHNVKRDSIDGIIRDTIHHTKHDNHHLYDSTSPFKMSDLKVPNQSKMLNRDDGVVGSDVGGDSDGDNDGDSNGDSDIVGGSDS